MQVSKISVMICAAAVCASPQLARADDTPSQARMREALRQKMATTATQAPATPSANNNTSPVAAQPMTDVKPVDTDAQIRMREALRQRMTTTVAQPQATPSASSMTSPVAAQPVAEVRPVDTDAQIRMREALRQKMATPTMQSPTPTRAVNVTAPASAVNVTTSAAFPSVPEVKPEDVEAQNRLREALRTKMAEAEAQKQAQMAASRTETTTTEMTEKPPVTAVSLAPTVMTSSQTPASTVKQDAVVESTAMSTDKSVQAAEGEAMKQAAVAKPMYDPSLPISEEKQKELNALLILYQADTITPQEYHERRAKILAAP